MHFAFHTHEPHQRQEHLARLIAKGAAVHGDTIEVFESFDDVQPMADGCIVLGIGGLGTDHALLPFEAYRHARKHVVFFDKGYTRNNMFRVAVNDFQPLNYLARAGMPPDRVAAWGIQQREYKVNGTHILLDGASIKYCAWKRLGDWGTWGRDMCAKIRGVTDRPIIYRPRPSLNYLPTILDVANVELSTQPLELDLARARVCVSYGGNIGFDCVMQGVPHFAMGDSVAQPLSEYRWQYVDCPHIPFEREVNQWLANLAYCQWSLRELGNGIAWANIRQQLRQH